MTTESRQPRVLNPDAIDPVSWRNGAGFTRELINDPTGWRLSVADLKVDATFSTFIGLDRIFLPSVDVLLYINGAPQTVPRYTTTTFPGEATVSIELIAGPGRAVNLITSRGHYTAGLVPISRPDWNKQNHNSSNSKLFVDLDAVLVEVQLTPAP
jgi:environmental stress-induced protein Ves